MRKRKVTARLVNDELVWVDKDGNVVDEPPRFNFPIWQLPFRGLGVLAGYVFVLIVPALVIGGFLLTLSIVLWFLGIRESVWPPWPF